MEYSIFVYKDLIENIKKVKDRIYFERRNINDHGEWEENFYSDNLEKAKEKLYDYKNKIKFEKHGENSYETTSFVLYEEGCDREYVGLTDDEIEKLIVNNELYYSKSECFEDMWADYSITRSGCYIDIDIPDINDTEYRIEYENNFFKLNNPIIGYVKSIEVAKALGIEYGGDITCMEVYKKTGFDYAKVDKVILELFSEIVYREYCVK